MKLWDKEISTEQAKWFDINDLPRDMAFDHNLVAEKALRTFVGTNGRGQYKHKKDLIYYIQKLLVYFRLNNCIFKFLFC